MRTFTKIIGLLLVVFLTACGGGGGSAGTVAGGSSSAGTTVATGTTSTTSTTTTPTTTTTVAGAVASDFIFELDKTSISNSGLDKAVLTVLAVDANRNVVSGIPVTVSVDSGGIFAASGSATDASGKLTGNITIGGDKANRTINATIRVSGLVKVASVLVTGSQVNVTTLPATPTPTQLITVNISTADSASTPVQNVAVTVSGTAGATGNYVTDISGSKVLTFNAPSSVGTYTLVVTGAGVSTTKIIQVLIPGGVGIPSAVGPISSASLGPQPSSIAPNASGSSLNRAKLSAKFLTSGNAGLQNMRVRFEIVQPSLGSGEAISTGDATLYTDASGTAEADYIAGTRSSPTNGVSVRACYKLTDFTSAADCPAFVAATLTVSGTPLSISISDDNTLAKGLGGIAYLKQFLVQVNDSAGVAVRDAVVSASVDITHYGKGRFDGTYPFGAVPPTINNLSLATTPVGTSSVSVVTGNAANAVFPGGLPAPSVLTTYYNVWCANEDTNRNGSLEAGEDVNNSFIIEPRKAEIIVSYVSGNKTDANGQMLIQVTYGQNVGRWLAYTLRATTSVAGSEGDASKSYITDVLAGDVANGSFLTPPYGSLRCTDVN